MLLSLDISTSCTGWSLWDDKKLVKAGAIETKTTTKAEKEKFVDHYAKLDYVFDELLKVCDGHEIKSIAAEAALKKFSSGKTTANTMAALIGFNFSLCYLLTRKFKCPVIKIEVKTARSQLGIKIPKGEKNKKKHVIAVVRPLYPDLNWATTKNDTLKSWCGDMADSIVIGLSALRKV